ncbi:MAG: ATP-binding cassette domain-containing protein [Promethearchaeota archaeon]
MISVAVKDVDKRFGSILALNKVTFTVYHGEIFGLIGPPRAGKTTALKILGGTMCPDLGSVETLGFEPSADSVRLTDLVGLKLHPAHLEPKLAVCELLEEAASTYHKPLGLKWLKQSFYLTDFLEKSGNQLNRCEQNRLALALAFINDPKLILLDEPEKEITSHFQEHVLRLIVKARNWGSTVILTSENPELTCRFCHRIAILEKGQIKAIGSPKHLLSQYFPNFSYLTNGGLAGIGG